MRGLLAALAIALALLTAGCAAAPDEQATVDTGTVAPAAASAVAPAATPVAERVATRPAEPPVQAPALPPPPLPNIGSADDGLSCANDADCMVKDVGSCCGYQPRCLNKSTQTFPEEVKARCASEGRVGTCGFREVSGCECVQGKCAALAGDGTDGRVH